MKLFKFDNDNDENCKGCNWNVARHFVLAETQEEADKLHKDDGDDGVHLCAECMCDVLIDGHHEISVP